MSCICIHWRVASLEKPAIITSGYLAMDSSMKDNFTSNPEEEQEETRGTVLVRHYLQPIFLFLIKHRPTLAQVDPCGHRQGAVAQVSQKPPHGVVVTANAVSMESLQQQPLCLVACTCSHRWTCEEHEYGTRHGIF